jgi:hypothetical protein
MYFTPGHFFSRKAMSAFLMLSRHLVVDDCPSLLVLRYQKAVTGLLPLPTELLLLQYQIIADGRSQRRKCQSGSSSGPSHI